MEQTIDLTRKNNMILSSQGESLQQIDEKNNKIHDKINKADRTVKEMEQNQYVRKLMLNGIAFLITVLNVMILIRIIFK